MVEKNELKKYQSKHYKKISSTFTAWISLWILAILAIPVLLVLFLFVEVFSWVDASLKGRRREKEKV